MASTRLVLLDFSAKVVGARVLADRYGANINRMVVPKGKTDYVPTNGVEDDIAGLKRGTNGCDFRR